MRTITKNALKHKTKEEHLQFNKVVREARKMLNFYSKVEDYEKGYFEILGDKSKWYFTVVHNNTKSTPCYIGEWQFRIKGFYEKLTHIRWMAYRAETNWYERIGRDDLTYIKELGGIIK